MDLRAPWSATERLRAPAVSVKAGMDNERTRLGLNTGWEELDEDEGRIKTRRKRTSWRKESKTLPRCRGVMRGAARRRAQLACRRNLEGNWSFLEGGARKGVVGMRESLGGGLRGMRMGRVSAGRRRVALNRNSVLGLFLGGRENNGETREGMMFWTFGLTPGWSTMITASNSQTSVSDNNFAETSFKYGVEPVGAEPGRSRSRAPHLRIYIYWRSIMMNKQAAKDVNETWNSVMDFIFGITVPVR